MNISVFIIECIIMAVLFGILVFGMLFTSPLTFISDYPPEIQEEYYRSQNREATKKTLSKIMAVKKIAALLVLLFLFAWMAHNAGAETFVQGLLAAYGYMVVLAVFDTCFLDWIHVWYQKHDAGRSVPDWFYKWSDEREHDYLVRNYAGVEFVPETGCGERKRAERKEWILT